MGSRIADRLLNEVSQTLFDDYDFMSTGTSGAALNDADVDLTSPVQIGSSDRNKVSESGSTTSFVENEVFVKTFLLNTVEPNSLPVNLQEFGLQKTVTGTIDMASRTTLNVSVTKDNTISFRIRFQGRVNRIN